MPHEKPPDPLPREIREIAPHFDPARYIDRADSPIKNLIDWVAGNTGPHSKLFHRLEAPADYGKSWQMARLALEFLDDPKFFVAVLPAKNATDVPAINAWLDAQLDRLSANPPSSDDVSGRIACLKDALSANGQRPQRHFLWLIDGWDEHPAPKFVANNLVDETISQFDHTGLSLIIACRDDFIIPSRLLRKKKSGDIPLRRFSWEEGLRQLKSIAPPPISEADLAALLAPYELTVPGWNECLYKKILAHHHADDPHWLTAAEVRDCWFSPLEEKIKSFHFDDQQIISDLIALVDGIPPPNSFAPEDFKERYGYSLNDAGGRIESLQDLAVVILTESRGQYQLVDGLADIIRLELRLQNPQGGLPHA